MGNVPLERSRNIRHVNITWRKFVVVIDDMKNEMDLVHDYRQGDTAGKLLYNSIQSAILRDLIGQFSQLN
jgi:hypothetical protein